MTDRPRRARRVQLSTPGSSEKMMQKASESKADHVFLDLEDAVAPSQKREARKKIVQALKTLNWTGKTRCVRINDLTTEYAFEDIIEVVEGAGEHLDTIMMTKVMTPADVLFADKLLHQLEKKLKLKRRIGLEALIEEVEGMQNVDAIAKSHAAAGMPGVRHGRLLGLDGRHQQERRRRPTAIPATSGTMPASGWSWPAAPPASIRSTARSPTSAIPRPIARSAGAR